MAYTNLQCIYSYDEFIQTIQCTNNSNYLEFITGKESKAIWFRGQASHKWHLLPSLYRLFDSSGKTSWDEDDWAGLNFAENLRLKLFKVRNYHLLQAEKMINNYLWMCSMQHYHIKTRLLDWSERADVAFYFALYYYLLEKKKWELLPIEKKGPNSFQDFGLPCVWVLLPTELIKQRVSQNLVSWDSGLIQDIYDVPNEKYDLLPPTPVIAPYNNDRIRIQAGTFVIFPKENFTTRNTKIFDKMPYLDGLSDSGSYLFQFVILHPEKCAQTLRKIGLKLSLLYPEMPIIDDEIEEDIYDFVA